MEAIDRLRIMKAIDRLRIMEAIDRLEAKVNVLLGEKCYGEDSCGNCLYWPEGGTVRRCKVLKVNTSASGHCAHHTKRHLS